jgi:hypothetical protein
MNINFFCVAAFDGELHGTRIAISRVIHLAETRNDRRNFKDSE